MYHSVCLYFLIFTWQSPYENFSLRFLSVLGWFYHAPAKRQDPKSEPVLVPAASQIPGLNSDLPPEDDIQRSLFRDTDTKYVRLAKSGGRQSKYMYQ